MPVFPLSSVKTQSCGCKLTSGESIFNIGKTKLWSLHDYWSEISCIISLHFKWKIIFSPHNSKYLVAIMKGFSLIIPFYFVNLMKVKQFWILLHFISCYCPAIKHAHTISINNVFPCPSWTIKHHVLPTCLDSAVSANNWWVVKEICASVQNQAIFLHCAGIFNILVINWFS